MSVREVSDVLQAQLTFQNTTVDVVRKQLIGMAVVLSNLAESTKRKRTELDAVVKWNVRYLDHPAAKLSIIFRDHQAISNLITFFILKHERRSKVTIVVETQCCVGTIWLLHFYLVFSQVRLLRA